ncbi:MAG: lycopene beta-cyclase CrtY [Pseudomonadota bacterium]
MLDFDIILVGGGLANGLIADRLASQRPDLRVLIIEARPTLGGDHTWSYHETDVTAEQDHWLRSIGKSDWSSQEVRFPSYSRQISTGYRTIVSTDLHNRLVSNERLNLSLETEVSHVSCNAVTLQGGQKLTSNCIIDGRGLTNANGVCIGYQKFFGLECELSAPHGLAAPILMDTTVDQIDGYRFMYSLPYSPTTLLIEDTYYSDTPLLDTGAIEQRVRAYASSKGWTIASVIREERGVLPVVLDGRLEMVWPRDQTVPRSGMRAGLFHQTTGYSLPFAVRIANKLPAIQVLESKAVAEFLRTEAQAAWDKQSFFRLLNRFLFLAAQGSERRRIFERFYRLPRPLIERFYAANLTAADKARIVLGRPPVALHKAVAAIPPRAAAARANGIAVPSS